MGVTRKKVTTTRSPKGLVRRRKPRRAFRFKEKEKGCDFSQPSSQSRAEKRYLAALKLWKLAAVFKLLNLSALFAFMRLID
jgi:hypothetical protein